MCEVLIDDFSLLNSSLEDARITPLGTDSGHTIGHAEAVHQVVDSFLRYARVVKTDDWGGRVQTFPIRITGAHRAARADLTARLRLALLRAKKVTIVPCDDWGAPGWWRIESSPKLVPVEDDFAALGPNGYDQYTIEVEVEAFTHSVDEYTAIADSGVDPSIIWDATIDDDTGWVALNGTLDYSAGNYIGITSDATNLPDHLHNDTLTVVDPGDYSVLKVEAKWDFEYGGGQSLLCESSGESGMGYSSRVALGSGWYEYTFPPYTLASLATGTRFRVHPENPDSTATNLKIRKIWLESAAPERIQNLWANIPGSAPVEGRIEVAGDVTAGMVLYTCPSLPATSQMPIEYDIADPDTNQIWPAGTYHLLASMTSIGSAEDLEYVDWSINSAAQSGRVYRQDMHPAAVFGDQQVQADAFVTLATDIVLPTLGQPSGTLAAVTDVTISGGFAAPGSNTLTVVSALLLWMGDATTGDTSPDYTSVAEDASRGAVWIEGPTVDKPLPGVQLGDGTPGGMFQDNSLILAPGRHTILPGLQRFFVAFAGGPTNPEIQLGFRCYPAWDPYPVPSARWTPLVNTSPLLPDEPILGGA